MPFPLIKLAYMGMRQLSKPLANKLKQAAKRSDFFRDIVCKPPAQIYHWYDTRVKMAALGLSKPEHVAPLTDTQAVELGAEMVGELVIFSVGAFVLYLEYKRSSWKDEEKETLQNERLMKLEYQVDNLQRAFEYQSERISELSTSQVTQITNKILNKLSLRSPKGDSNTGNGNFMQGASVNTPSNLNSCMPQLTNSDDVMSRAVAHVLGKTS